MSKGGARDGAGRKLKLGVPTDAVRVSKQSVRAVEELSRKSAALEQMGVNVSTLSAIEIITAYEQLTN